MKPEPPITTIDETPPRNSQVTVKITMSFAIRNLAGCGESSMNASQN
jgi:hypothetical protein